ncbi:MAG: hypothetical protein ABSB40_12160 [Nitrososphaeria archaeon]|jgi:hypothetical protein
MDLKLVKNTPYVILLLLISFLFNAVLRIPTPWTMPVVWILEYYSVFWIYQNYAYRAHELSWPDIFRRKAILGLLLFLGAIVGYRLYYGTVTALVCAAYAALVVSTLVLLEHSLYN